MAGFDPDKDKVIKKWKCEETGLILAIHSYDGGEPKLQVGPRVLKKKDGSDRAPSKAGRLTVADVEWLYDIIDDIKDELEANLDPAG